MKKITFATAGIMTVLTPMALAFDGGNFHDYARVTDVDPIYERVNVPRKECYSDYVPESRYERSSGSVAGPVIGGVAGGLLGSRFGRGSGRVASAAAGAVVGAIVGDRLSDRNRGSTEVYEREVRRCRSVDDWEKRLTGYRVTYEYAGHEYTTTLPYDPGSKLAVNVAVTPDIDDRRYDRHDDRWDR
ncbi:MAG TPA: glycine zipper 2TM domain-containing protein [Burkholderiales bacterium]|nr:glycine zipper 2TM domain-containing protein [Burkholderiales bacterium]